MKPLHFSYHAIEKSQRLYKIEEAELKLLLEKAEPINLSFWRQVYKTRKYWMQAAVTSYFYSPRSWLNFVVLETATHYLVLTVFKKKQKRYTIDRNAPNIATSQDVLPAYA